MAFKLSLFLLGVVLVGTIDARSFNQASNRTISNHLKFMGETTTTRFYKSVQNANYRAARQDCLDNYMQIASFETDSKLEDVRKFLNDHDDSATTFWVGGVADGDILACRNTLTHDCFIWEETETALGDHIVWSRRSNALYNANSKMYLIGRKRRTPVFDFDDNTNNYRYICEEPMSQSV